MRRGLLILGLGLAMAVLAYAVVYSEGGAQSRQMLHNPLPELAWLRQEYHLNDAQFARIAQLHEAYLRDCRERGRLIQQQNDKLKQLLAHATTVTPKIQSLLAERAKARADCETAMLKHFTQISRIMSPEEGRRYLVWMEASWLNNRDMPMSPQWGAYQFFRESR